MKKVAIYARVSSQRQKDEETIDSQVNSLLEFGAKQGFEIPENWIFLDNGVSGENMERAGLDDLRDMIKTESVDAILIYAPDRLSRSYPHQLILLEEFRRQFVEVYFMKKAPQNDNPEAIMLNHFQGIFAEYERALILDRSRRGRIHKAKQGDPSILTTIAYGYHRIKNDRETVIEIDEEKAAIVKQIFMLYIYENHSLNMICRHLANNGIKSPKGLSHWYRSTVVGILENKSYIGSAFYGRTEKYAGKSDKIRHLKGKTVIKPKRAIRNRPEEEWFEIRVPPMISQNDFELAQERIKKNRVLSLRNTQVPSLLQGLVICGNCGLPFYKKSRSTTCHYQCRSQIERKLKSCNNKKVEQQALDELVYTEIMNILQNPYLIREELRRRELESQKIGETARREACINKDLSALSKERDRLLDAYQSSAIDLETLSERNQLLDKRKNGLESELKGLQTLKLQATMQTNWENNFERILTRITKASQEITIKEKQQVVRLLVEKIIITEDEIKIVHCISPKNFPEGSPLCCEDPCVSVGLNRFK